MDDQRDARMILGKGVMDTGAMNIGKVRDIVINIRSWSVEYLLVKIPRQVSKELGVGGIMGATARVTPEFIEKIGDLVKLNVGAEELIEKVELE